MKMQAAWRKLGATLSQTESLDEKERRNSIDLERGLQFEWKKTTSLSITRKPTRSSVSMERQNDAKRASPGRSKLEAKNSTEKATEAPKLKRAADTDSWIQVSLNLFCAYHDLV